MTELVNEIIKGRKTFFIAPDRSLFPQSYLEEYLVLGYECYFIDVDIFLPLEVKIDIILSIFKDSILFFNIDSPIQNISWSRLISQLHEKYPEAHFGVTYSKRQSLTEKHQIEKLYLYTIGIQCGCIQLEYQKKNNFLLIEKMLYANQAMGRRKNVRAVCTGNCKVQFLTDKNAVVQGNLTDISISHFSVTLQEGEAEISQYEKITDIVFTVKGLRFHSDAVLYMTRPTNSGILYVFAFSKKNGEAGLDFANKKLLVPKIYEVMSENCLELLGKLFNSATRKRNGSLQPNLNALSDINSLMDNLDKEDII